MGVGMADYDQDGKPDLFVTNDTFYNYLFHNTGKKFEEVAFQAGVALVEDGEFISGMGLDFRDYNNDGYPDIVFVALNNQTFPIFQNKGGKNFEEVTFPTGDAEIEPRDGGVRSWIFRFRQRWLEGFVRFARACGISDKAGTGDRTAEHGVSQSGAERAMDCVDGGG